MAFGRIALGTGLILATFAGAGAATLAIRTDNVPAAAARLTTIGGETVTAVETQVATSTVTVTVTEKIGTDVPALVGVKLDLAKKTLETAGLDSRVDGGGLIGIFDDSNWTVCSTEPEAGVRVAPLARVVLKVEKTCPTP